MLLNHTCQSDAFSLPHEGGPPLPPRPDPHSRTHTLLPTWHTQVKKLVDWSPKGLSKLETNTVVFPLSQSNPVQRPQDLLDQ